MYCTSKTLWVHHISTNLSCFYNVRLRIIKKKCTLFRVQKKKTIVLSLNREPFVLFRIKSEESYSSMSAHVIYIDLYGLCLSPSSYHYAWGISSCLSPSCVKTYASLLQIYMYIYIICLNQWFSAFLTPRPSSVHNNIQWPHNVFFQRPHEFFLALHSKILALFELKWVNSL